MGIFIRKFPLEDSTIPWDTWSVYNAKIAVFKRIDSAADWSLMSRPDNKVKTLRKEESTATLALERFNREEFEETRRNGGTDSPRSDSGIRVIAFGSNYRHYVVGIARNTRLLKRGVLRWNTSFLFK